VWNGTTLRARWGVLDSELSLRFPDKLQWRVDWSGQGTLVGFLRDTRGRVTGLTMWGRELQRQVPPNAGASDPAPGPASAGTRG
jgi:hypothetical protein